MKNPARKFSEVIVSIVGADGTERMARCLLDTGCTKSMILKKFTDKNDVTNFLKKTLLNMKHTVVNSNLL